MMIFRKENKNYWTERIKKKKSRACKEIINEEEVDGNVFLHPWNAGAIGTVHERLLQTNAHPNDMGAEFPDWTSLTSA